MPTGGLCKKQLKSGAIYEGHFQDGKAAGEGTDRAETVHCRSQEVGILSARNPQQKKGQTMRLTVFCAVSSFGARTISLGQPWVLATSLP